MLALGCWIVELEDYLGAVWVEGGGAAGWGVVWGWGWACQSFGLGEEVGVGQLDA